jgi:hypothetical protein
MKINKKMTLGIFSVFWLYLFINTAGFSSGGRHENYAKIGNWIKENTPTHSSVGLVEIGTVGWHADRFIVDILGLVNKYNSNFIAQKDLYGWLSKYQPDYILRHEPSWPHEKSTELLEKLGYYAPVENFNINGYLMLKKIINNDSLIQKIPFAKQRAKTLLTEIHSTSKSTPPFVQIEDDILFAHAPSKFIINTQDYINFEFTYGLKKTAHSKHDSICFTLVNFVTRELIFKDCIEKGVDISNMQRRVVIDLTMIKRSQLELETSCTRTCNHAWSYFSNFVLE